MVAPRAGANLGYRLARKNEDEEDVALFHIFGSDVVLNWDVEEHLGLSLGRVWGHCSRRMVV